MEEDEEDRVLSRLGVASADVDDVEHDILTKVENDAICNGEGLEYKKGHSVDATSAKRAKLVSKLQALKFEIDAVAASIVLVKSAKEDEECSSDGVDLEECKTKNVNAPDYIQVAPDRLNVQNALAAERLYSLKQTKARIENEIAKFDESTPSTSIGRSNLLSKLVEEEPKHKRKFIKNQHSKNSNKKVFAYDEDAEFDAMLDAASSGFVETERDTLVRKGILTPFHKLKGFERCVQQPGSSSRSGLPEEANEDFASTSIARVTQSMSQIAESRSTTKLVDAKSLPKLEGPTHTFQRLKAHDKHPASQTSAAVQKRQKTKKLKRPLPGKKWREKIEDEDLQNGLGEEKDSVVINHQSEESGEVEDPDDGGSSCVALEGGLRIPDFIFTRLFDYQKVGVQWLWELHCQRAGGIIGDEMGLGKTAQVLSFLGSLHFSNKYKPSIVICPVTLLRQWQREAKKWYAKFRVEILHDSAHGSITPAQSKDSDGDRKSDSDSVDSKNERPHALKPSKRWDNLINGVLESESGLLITTYEQLRILGEKLLDIEWGYAILDEGHRIRNPNAEITLTCKQLQTVHRIIMTGAPIQNKLAELWSLFDFIFPGKLGVLPVFEMEFAVPISVGGYANATPLQVSTAYRCAVTLRDLVMPYLLRRMKADVNACLPKKTEHVLFCSLTSEQRSLYRAFLASSEVEQIFDGSRNSLFGIDVMRKICNHPDLLEREQASLHPDYGNPERSGKMKVVSQLLELWKEQGHRVLVFTQSKQMLDILENFLMASGYIYRRMDGSTPVKQRMALIDEFNNSTEVFVFVLTTKVGGLGTNLTGADRIIIYDPDWNPSTDIQARERAWRIGQTRDVTVYRLIMRGTIEEKVYHRQIYKHFLTNKVLNNPQQKRFFKARDMRDLFTLQDEEGDRSTETSNIFSQLNGDVNIDIHEEGRVARISSSDVVQGGKTMDLGTDTSQVKGKKKVNDSGSEINEETNVLKSLFDANGIHSAVNHDVIMNANDVDRGNKMEEQASLIAQKAADALRQSRMLRNQDRFSVPTWTGKSGAAGAPSSVRRKFGSTVNTGLLGSSKVSPETSSSKAPGFQVGVSSGKVLLSSVELLAKMRGTHEKAVFDGLEHQLGSSPSASHATPAASRSKPSNNNTIVQPEVLIRQMCTFMQQRGGSAGSGCIVEHFKDMIPTKDLPLFRNLLKQIAVLEKDAAGHGSQWVLKSEYLD